jgi:hypothetical protein
MCSRGHASLIFESPDAEQILAACSSTPVRKKVNQYIDHIWSRCVECCESVLCSLCAEELGQHIVHNACLGCAMGWVTRSHCILQHADLKYQACIVTSNTP